jgi:hypothetical protein
MAGKGDLGQRPLTGAKVSASIATNPQRASESGHLFDFFKKC